MTPRRPDTRDRNWDRDRDTLDELLERIDARREEREIESVSLPKAQKKPGKALEGPQSDGLSVGQKILAGIASATVLAAVITGGFTLTGKVLDLQQQSAGTAPSVCLAAYENVHKALENKLYSPERLDPLNSEDIDRRCGEEVVIAEEMLKNDPSLRPPG